MFSYICLGTNDMERAKALYDAALAPLGLQRCATPGEEDWSDWAGGSIPRTNYASLQVVDLPGKSTQIDHQILPSCIPEPR